MLVNCNNDMVKSLLDSGTGEVTNNTWSSYCDFRNINASNLHLYPMHGIFMNNVGFSDISDNTFVYGVGESIFVQNCPFTMVLRNKIIRPCCLYGKGTEVNRYKST